MKSREWLEAFREVPALHDMAAATLALGLPGEEEASAVVAMIEDEALRNETVEKLRTREKDASSDPFAE